MEMNILRTFDLNLAATLFSLGFPIKGIHATGNGDQMEFFFEEEDRLKQTINDFYDRKLRVEPNEIFWARKEIISRMMNEKVSQKLSTNRG